MYKKLLITIFVALILFITQTAVYAQNKDLQKGQRFFAKKEYKLAIPFLKKYSLNHKDKAVKRDLFICYLETQQDDEALKLVKRMIKNPEAEAVDFLNYANLLKKLHKYQEAK